METDYGFFFEDRKTMKGINIYNIIRDISPTEIFSGAAAVIWIFGGPNKDYFYISV